LYKPKHPGRVEGGRLSARRRWGPQRIVRLDTLDPITRDIIRAILTARENAKAASAVDPETALPEVHCHARPAA
jgi:hypothetical protein